MAYNNFFPTSYQQMLYPQQAFQQNNISPQQPNMQNMQYQQTMTPPTIHAEIIQANKAEAMDIVMDTAVVVMTWLQDSTRCWMKHQRNMNAKRFAWHFNRCKHEEVKSTMAV